MVRALLHPAWGSWSNPNGGLAFHNTRTDGPWEGHQGERTKAVASALGLAFSQSTFFCVWGCTLHPLPAPLPPPPAGAALKAGLKVQAGQEALGPAPAYGTGDSLTADSDKCLSLAQTKGVLSKRQVTSASFRTVLPSSYGLFLVLCLNLKGIHGAN